MFQSWVSSAVRQRLVPFDDLVASVQKLPATVPEVGLEPPWTRWPRPAPVVLRSVDGRYTTTL